MEKKERTETFSFYNVLSWLVWGFFICWIFFMLFLLLTGGSRKPTYTVENAALSAVAAEDPALAAHGKTGADWYRLDLDVTVAGSAWSPLRFEIEGFNVTGSEPLKRSLDGFVEVESPVVFSKIAPASFTLSYYVNCPAGRDALVRALADAGFCPGRYRHGLGFVKFESHINVPAFYLKDYALNLTEADKA